MCQGTRDRVLDDPPVDHALGRVVRCPSGSTLFDDGDQHSLLGAKRVRMRGTSLADVDAVVVKPLSRVLGRWGRPMDSRRTPPLTGGPRVTRCGHGVTTSPRILPMSSAVLFLPEAPSIQRLDEDHRQRRRCHLDGAVIDRRVTTPPSCPSSPECPPTGRSVRSLPPAPPRHVRRGRSLHTPLLLNADTTTRPFRYTRSSYVLSLPTSAGDRVSCLVPSCIRFLLSLLPLPFQPPHNSRRY